MPYSEAVSKKRTEILKLKMKLIEQFRSLAKLYIDEGRESYAANEIERIEKLRKL